VTSMSYDLGTEKDGSMPQSDEKGPWFEISNFGKHVHFKTGAGRLHWGEGIEDPEYSSKEMKKSKKRSAVVEN